MHQDLRGKEKRHQPGGARATGALSRLCEGGGYSGRNSPRPASQIVDRLTNKGVAFKAIQQGAIDTSNSNGRLMLNLLAAFAEFETDLRKDRQREGIEKAKAAGVYKGRKRTVPSDEVKRLRAGGTGPAEIARKLGIGRASVYRALNEAG